MNDKQQIEEMASIICKETSNKGVCEKCAFKKHTQFGFVYQCPKFDSAEDIYNAGYRKIPEDSVVLSREEYEKLKDLEKCFDYNLVQERKQIRKETAREIVCKIKEILKKVRTVVNYDDYGDGCGLGGYDCGYAKQSVDFRIDELAKQYDVEIRE